jgi:hypothetical protein
VTTLGRLRCLDIPVLNMNAVCEESVLCVRLPSGFCRLNHETTLGRLLYEECVMFSAQTCAQSSPEDARALDPWEIVCIVGFPAKGFVSDETTQETRLAGFRKIHSYAQTNDTDAYCSTIVTRHDACKIRPSWGLAFQADTRFFSTKDCKIVCSMNTAKNNLGTCPRFFALCVATSMQ